MVIVVSGFGNQDLKLHVPLKSGVGKGFQHKRGKKGKTQMALKGNAH